jgi:chromate transporter
LIRVHLFSATSTPPKTCPEPDEGTNGLRKIRSWFGSSIEGNYEPQVIYYWECLETMEEKESHKRNVTRFALFLAFSRISLSSFGGAIFWARRELVERQRWLTEQEFVDLFTVGQLLPGPNVLNLTVMVGYRFAGWTGAAAAMAGFLGWPCLVVIGMGVLYQHYGALPHVQRALTGMSSVAAGLLLATVIKLAMVLPRHWRPWLFGMLAFVGVGVMRWPLLWVMGALAPWAVFAAWKDQH